MTVVICPQCGFHFDTSYGRIVACGDCPSATMGNCGHAKCPKCEHEFPLGEPSTETQQYGRRVA